MQRLLTEKGLHLWHIDFDAASPDVEQYRAVLNDAERKRARRFHFRRHEHQYIIAHGALRYILGLYLHRSPAEVSMSALKLGKPVLTDSPLEFSLSHSDARGVVAIARRHVGVDIERLRPIPDAKDLARRFFSAAEARHISDCPAESQSAEFLRYWTWKEAYLKGCGVGLHIPFNSLPSPIDDSNASKGQNISDQDRELNVATDWTFHEFQVEHNYIGAVAVNGGFDKVEDFFWIDEQLRCGSSYDLQELDFVR